MLDIAKIEREWTSGDYSISNSEIDDLIAEVKRLQSGLPDNALRDHFAGLAMQALAPQYDDQYHFLARDAYNIADAMLAEKRRRG